MSCARCGKVMRSASGLGRFTGFLLRDMRCSCAKPMPVDAAGQLLTRFVPAPAQLTRRRKAFATMLHTRSVKLTGSDAALVELKSGELIGGIYVLEDLVGQGGMGLVYRARQSNLDRTVALKFIAPSMVSPGNWALFQKEAKILSSLNHSTICQIYDLGIHGGALPFCAMDYIEGKNLEQVILSGGPLSVGATLEIFVKVATGLSYAHRRSVVHKDIKPANIMVRADGQGSVDIKILDFGIADLNEGQNRRHEKSDMIVGTALYMSPEQIRGAYVDLRSDIYSLGCSMFETLTGVLPFEGDFNELKRLHQSEIPPLLTKVTAIDFSPQIEAVLQKCMHKNPERRYQTANELVIDLERILEGKKLQFARDELQPVADLLKQLALAKTSVRQKRLTIYSAAGLLFVTALSVFFIHRAPTTKQAVLPSGRSVGAINADFGITGMPVNLNADTPFSKKYSTPNAASNSNKTIVGSVKDGHFFVSENRELNGNLVKNFDFGSSSGGTLQVVSPTTGEMIRSLSIGGPLKVSSTDLLRIRFFNNSENIEDTLLGFRPQDLNGIDLLLFARDSAEILRVAVDRFTHLYTLSLGKYQKTPVNCRILNKCLSLSSLALTGWDNSLEPHCSLGYLPNLRCLSMRGCGGPLKGFFEVPVEENYLETFLIFYTKLSSQDVRYLSNLPNLKMLSLENCSLTESALPELFNSESLVSLTIKDERFAVNKIDITALKAPQSLRLLEIDYNSRMAPPNKAIEKRLRELVPRVRFVKTSFQ